MLSILKEREVIKKNRKIIEEKDFSYDPTINEDKMKGAFNSYVDSLVIKNFLIEQIYTRLKINKTMATQFVNKLDGNQVLILSKVIHEFIKDIQDKYVSINDYILKTSFDELQGTYNVLQQQEKINEIVKQNQAEQNEVLQENIPAEEEEEDEKQNFINFLTKSIYKLKGNTGLRAVSAKKILLGEFVTGRPESFERSTNINELYETELIPLLDKDDKREARLSIQYALKKQFLSHLTSPMT